MNHDMAVLIDCMNQHNGLLPYTDKSDSKLIKLNLRMSKSAFKRAVGHLLKTNQIIMTEGKIRLKDNKKMCLQQSADTSLFGYKQVAINNACINQ